MNGTIFLSLLSLWLCCMISLIVYNADPVRFSLLMRDIREALGIRSKCGPFDDIGESLIRAVEDDNLFLVDCILTLEGADINYKDKKYGKSALMKASDYGHHAIALFLVSKGGDVNDSDNRGKTVIEYATDDGHPRVLNAIYAHPDFNHVKPFADEEEKRTADSHEL